MRGAPAAALVGAMLITFAAPAAANTQTRVVATGFVAVTTGTGPMQIFSFDLQGGHEKRLTQGTADRHYPSLAPDGTRLLYTGEDGGLAEVYLLDLVDPSATPRVITKAPITANSASWSPDGATILYSALLPRQKAYQIFKSHPDGSGVVQLTHTGNSGNASPVFSPDGSRIAYINGSPAGGKTSGLVDRIWLMDSDGTNARPLTAGPRDAYPAWLNTNTVLFARSFGADRGTQVFAVGLDGAERALSPAGQLLVEPKPLPDGRGYGATQSTRSGLGLVKVERSDHAALTSTVPAAGFVVTPIEVPPHDGSVFTLDWILVDAPAARGGGAGIPVWLAAAILGAVALAIAVLVGLRRLRRT